MKDLLLLRLEEMKNGYAYYRLNIETGRQELAYSFTYLNYVPPPFIEPRHNFSHPVRKGDLIDYEGDIGTVAWVTSEEVNAYFGQSLENFDRDLFINYKQPRGRTIWYL